MRLFPTPIAGCFRAEPTCFEDARGNFCRVLETRVLREVDPAFEVVRVNRSFTRACGTIRGLHFQHAPRSEGKLVQCLVGAIFDVCVDLRPDSLTYRRWVGFELSAVNAHLLLVPRGCAHGFQTLAADSLVEYFCTDEYAPELEGGLRWDDPALAVEWPRPCTQTSDKDAAWPLLER